MTLGDLLPGIPHYPFKADDEVIDVEVFERDINGETCSTVLATFSIEYPQQPPVESVLDIPFGSVYTAMESVL